jgi:hypothetical protein
MPRVSTPSSRTRGFQSSVVLSGNLRFGGNPRRPRDGAGPRLVADAETGGVAWSRKPAFTPLKCPPSAVHPCVPISTLEVHV